MVDVRITRCALHGASDRAAVHALVGGLADDIDAMPWPEGERERIYIRHLQVEGVPSTVGGALQQALRDALAQVQTIGCNDPVTGDESAVQFPDLAEELASLTWDLAHDYAHQRWWWQKRSELLALPPGAAIARLWADHVVHVPTILARLESQHSLSVITNQFTADDIGQVLRAVVHSVNASPALAEVSKNTDFLSGVGGTPSYTSELLSVRHLRRWEQSIRLHQQPVVMAHLAAIMALLEDAPLYLCGDTASKRVTTVRAVFIQNASNPNHDISTNPPVHIDEPNEEKNADPQNAVNNGHDDLINPGGSGF